MLPANFSIQHSTSRILYNLGCISKIFIKNTLFNSQERTIGFSYLEQLFNFMKYSAAKHLTHTSAWVENLGLCIRKCISGCCLFCHIFHASDCLLNLRDRCVGSKVEDLIDMSSILQHCKSVLICMTEQTHKCLQILQSLLEGSVTNTSRAIENEQDITFCIDESSDKAYGHVLCSLSWRWCWTFKSISKMYLLEFIVHCNSLKCTCNARVIKPIFIHTHECCNIALIIRVFAIKTYTVDGFIFVWVPIFAD